MPFKIALSETYRAPVEVKLPNEAGVIETSEFTAVFKRCTVEELADLAAKSARVVMSEVLVGTDGLVAADGTSVPFSAETKAVLLNIPQALHGLNEAFFKSINSAREKN